jgi:hypothetical protein
MLIGISILALVTVIPVKIGANLFSAGNSNLISCVIATIIGTALSLTSINYIGGFTGILIAYLLMSLVYSKVFQLPFSSSLKLTFVIIIIQIGCIQGLVDFGIYILEDAGITFT